MGKFSVLLGGVLFLFACQPPSGQAPVVKPSVASPSPIMSPSTSNSPVPTSSVTLVESPSPTPSFSSRPVEVVAGTGAKGFQDGPAKQATFNAVQGLCVHPTSGDIYILDTHKIRKLSPDGQVSTVAGSEEAGFQDGSLNEARFNGPHSCDFDDKGNLFISDRLNFRIRQISPENRVSTLLGNGEAESKDGNSSTARLYYPENIVITSTGKIYLNEGYKIRMFSQGVLITLNAHQPSEERFETHRNGLIQTQATFGSIMSLDKNAQDEILIADYGARSIRKINTNHEVSTISKQPLRPIDITYLQESNTFYISELGFIYLIDAIAGNLSVVASYDSMSEENQSFIFSKIKDIVIQNDFLIINDYGSNQIKRMKL